MRDSSTTRSRTRTAMAPPTTRRAASRRATAVTSSLPSAGRAPSVEPVKAGMKRKERDFEDAPATTPQPDPTDETKIDVFVRCRGRNKQEVRDNSGVVVTTDGVCGKTVELSMGPNTISKKSYLFDGVFSPAADQQMIFDEVVTPVIDEVLRGFNCTIFAYGQTGTGKTYTMSGNISDHALLPDDAGIIPRVLDSLFYKLESSSHSSIGNATPESSVKISFIELYNEELRDLISTDDKSTLKIFDGDSKRGAATVVQGMEERYVPTAKKGIELLRQGSHKRQVAATKCNDLSSRSHTVFSITAYTKHVLSSGEEVVTSGKLNLVDLAGSENIGRSGAENKRATEAGLINRSLLTLGRVINALVDRSSHIPYRESKLTRLLQDSLGGRTKTCIIATVSAATANLDETISSLEYAFRAKNIRNKPQIKLIPKMTLLKEFTLEIERLRSELTATRQRNGVYLTQEAHDKLMTEAESDRILLKEQGEKIQTIESKLTRKGQDLLDLATNFEKLKKQSETTDGTLLATKSLLENSTKELSHTKRMLEDETLARQQHERTEQQLMILNSELETKLDQSTLDNAALHLKLGQRSELHARNREQYGKTQLDVLHTATLVESQLAEFQKEQQVHVDALSTRMHDFVQHELNELHAATADLEKTSEEFERSHKEVSAQTTEGRAELDKLLDNIKTLKEELKQKVRTGLDKFNEAASRISEGITTEVETFQTELGSSYSDLGVDLKAAFDEILKETSEQREEMQKLRNEMTVANQELRQTQSQSVDSLSDLVDKDRTARDQENKDLMQRIQELVEANMHQQELRMGAVATISAKLKSAEQSHSAAGDLFANGSEKLAERSNTFSNKLTETRDTMETRVQSDSAMATKRMQSFQAATSSIHDDTARIVKDQLQHLSTETNALDTTMESIQEKNNLVYAARERALSAIASTVQESYSNFGGTFTTSFERIKSLGVDMVEQTDGLLESINKDTQICQQLEELRDNVEQNELEELVHTGQTPMHRAYSFPEATPTSDGESSEECIQTDFLEDGHVSPARPRSSNKTLLFSDNDASSTQKLDSTANSTTTLRELDINTMHNTSMDNNTGSLKDTVLSQKDSAGGKVHTAHPSLKRSISASVTSKVPSKRRKPRSTAVANGALARIETSD